MGFPPAGSARARLDQDLAPVMGLRPEASVAHNKDAPYIALYLKKWNVTLEVTMKRIDRRRG